MTIARVDNQVSELAIQQHHKHQYEFLLQLITKEDDLQTLALMFTFRSSFIWIDVLTARGNAMRSSDFSPGPLLLPTSPSAGSQMNILLRQITVEHVARLDYRHSSLAGRQVGLGSKAAS